MNEIFNPDRVSSTYNQSDEAREQAIALDRGTNYGVVRLELLERIYADMYTQRLRDNNESNWQHRIIPNTVVSTIEDLPDDDRVRLHLHPQKYEQSNSVKSSEAPMDVDAVLIATGYIRNAHEDMLTSVAHLISTRGSSRSKVPVSRDYRVKLDGQKVDSNAGIWLQGCNESTHGVSCYSPFLFDRGLP